MADFTLPELGENVTSGDVLRVLVKPGDVLTKDQSVLELETDKATIEVPTSVVGRVTAVNVKVGDKINVGQVVLSVENSSAAPKEASATPEKSETPKTSEKSERSPSDAEPREVRSAPAPTRGGAPDNEAPQEQRKEVPKEKQVPQEEVEEEITRTSESPKSASGKVVDISRGTRPPADVAPMPPATVAPASPSVRRLARELGVDINRVVGTQPDGRISMDDVKGEAKRIVESAGRSTEGAAEALPDFARWGEVDRQPMRAVRRKTAEHISAAWRSIPHVTQHDSADITELEALRKRYTKTSEAAGGSLTITAIAVKVCAAALRKFPQFNASIDAKAEEIIFKKYVHIGVAVDTDRGLLVPVIRDADLKNIVQLSAELSQLAEKARSHKIALEEMQGGSFSISNLGGIGGGHFTPIVNAPEVAILGISRARTVPAYQDGVLAARLMLPLSLSYDHRVVDGADGARFLRWVVEAFEQPFLLALEG